MEKRRTQAERSNESRRRLIEAAITLLAERGYAGASLAAIGERAGVSRGLVTHHFGSKEQCIAEVTTFIREAVIDRLAGDPGQGGLAAIDNLVRTYLSEEPGLAAPPAPCT
ncbi:TetR/AcrR family transcriptional regulator [Nocardioides sambongensis]|uniref:TetR/AcrR family transcriptional regulator n=1 Tax=Nocardioides sambongensis TaxID=2589074 RepID=UPI001127E391|nr:helix-turn-helix domain-containing protein [Nocardioides sambongensis]